MFYVLFVPLMLCLSCTGCKIYYDCYLRNCQDEAVTVKVFPPASDLIISVLEDSIPSSSNVEKVKLQLVASKLHEKSPFTIHDDSIVHFMLPAQSTVWLGLDQRLEQTALFNMVIYGTDGREVLLDTRSDSAELISMLKVQSRLFWPRYARIDMGVCHTR